MRGSRELARRRGLERDDRVARRFRWSGPRVGAERRGRASPRLCGAARPKVLSEPHGAARAGAPRVVPSRRHRRSRISSRAFPRCPRPTAARSRPPYSRRAALPKTDLRSDSTLTSAWAPTSSKREPPRRLATRARSAPRARSSSGPKRSQPDTEARLAELRPRGRGLGCWPARSHSASCRCRGRMSPGPWPFRRGTAQAYSCECCSSGRCVSAAGSGGFAAGRRDAAAGPSAASASSGRLGSVAALAYANWALLRSKAAIGLRAVAGLQVRASSAAGARACARSPLDRARPGTACSSSSRRSGTPPPSATARATG